MFRGSSRAVVVEQAPTMPGIVGIISRRPPAECERIVECMIGSMKHETFYRSGLQSAPELGVYGGWVAIEDSCAARQPFKNERKYIPILLSGEFPADRGWLTDLARPAAP